MIKRIFDTIVSFFGLIFFSPLILAIAILIKLDSAGPVFYRGARIGQFRKSFRVFKFRTMIPEAEKLGGPSTAADDKRLIEFGKFLRKYKLDELPQLLNVLKGEMSFVGPRPEVPSELETYEEEIKNIILSVKPGMTDLATLHNIHEEEILRGSKNPHQSYREIIKPQKLKLAVEYVKIHSFWLDVKIIFKTLKSVFF